MAVVKVTEKFDGRSGSGDFKSGRSYTRKFDVYTNDFRDDSLIVSAGLGIRFGMPYVSPHAADHGAVCRKIDCQQRTDSPDIWSVVVTYSSELNFPEGGSKDKQSGNPSDNQKEPNLRPAIWKFGFTKVTQAVTKDFADVPVAILNSANQPYDPPIEVERPYFTITVTKNYSPAVLTPEWFTDRFNKINNDIWNGYPAYSIKINDITADSQWENNQAYYSVTQTLIHNPDLWHPYQVLDVGYYHLDGTNLVQNRDAYGSPLSAPQLLDGAGGLLAAGDPPVFNDFTLYEAVSFEALQVP